MKKVLLLIALAATSAHLAQGAAVTATNYNEGSGAQRPLSSVAGTGILTGGVIAIGSWATDPRPLFSQLPNAAVWESIVSSFISFGAPTSVGASFSGLYESVAQAQIAQGSPLDGKTIYTLIGNAATLSSSTEGGLVTDGSTFAFDNPLFQARAEISATNAQILFGKAGGPSVESALGAAPSLQLATTVPEPFSATLLLTGLALIFRRRR
ncbi:MAG: hypothetical protein ACKV19_29725 [Verrucomicrobiales bacterium]